MSALRVDSVRLCWLEAFLAVESEENISAAALQLGVSQPTVSRYIKSLERWAGKRLIEPGKVSDPENPRLSVAITEDGRQLHELAVDIVSTLAGFRTEAAQTFEMIDDMRGMVDRMRLDLDGPSPSKTVLRIAANIETHTELVGALNENTPLEPVKVLHRALRTFFATYEEHKKAELALVRSVAKGKSRKLTSPIQKAGHS